MLGVDENTQNLSIEILKKGILKIIRFRPDRLDQPAGDEALASGEEDGVVTIVLGEYKNRGYQWMTDQLEAEMQYADDNNLVFQLVVRHNTKSAKGVVERLAEPADRELQGDTPVMIRYLGNGLGEDEDGRLYKANAETHGWERWEPGDEPLAGEGPATPGSGSGGPGDGQLGGGPGTGPRAVGPEGVEP